MATAAAAGTGTKEYQAIKLHYAMLVNTLGKTVDPADFARKMGEKSLINDGEFCQAPSAPFFRIHYQLWSTHAQLIALVC